MALKQYCTARHCSRGKLNNVSVMRHRVEPSVPHHDPLSARILGQLIAALPTLGIVSLQYGQPLPLGSPAGERLDMYSTHAKQQSVWGRCWWIPQLFVDRAQVGVTLLIQVWGQHQGHLCRTPGPNCKYSANLIMY
jgi:hypothetical protein